MMTSLDMKGVSISLYPADSQEIELLARATPLSAWPGLSYISPVTTVALSDGLTPITPLASEHEPTREFLTDCCNVMIGGVA